MTSPARPQMHQYVERRFNRRFAIGIITICGLLSGGAHWLHGFQIKRNAGILREQAQAAEQAGNTSEAIRQYQRYVAFRPRDVDARIHLAKLREAIAESAREWRDLHMELSAILQLDDEQDHIRRLAAEVSLRLGRHEEALSHVARLRRTMPDDVELIFLEGRCHTAGSSFASAARAFEECIRQDETHVPYHVQLSAVILAHGGAFDLKRFDPTDQTDASPRDVVERLLGRMIQVGQPVFEAHLARSRFRLHWDSLDQAADDATRAVRLAGHNVDVLTHAASVELRRAEAAGRTGDVARQEQVLKTAAGYVAAGRNSDGDHPEFFLLQARILLLQDQPEQAATVLREGRKLVASLLESADRDSRDELNRQGRGMAFTLADILTYRSVTTPVDAELADVAEIAEIRSLIQELRRQTSGSLSGDFIEAGLQMRQLQWAKARPLLESLVDSTDIPQGIVPRVAMALSECYRQLLNPGAELSLLRNKLSDEPLWLQGRIRLAEALTAAGHVNEAIEEYRKLSRVPATFLPLARLLAMKQLARPANDRRWEEATQAVERAAAAGQNQAQVAVIGAEILFHQGRFDQAEQLLVTASIEFPNSPEVRAALAELQVRQLEITLSQRLASAMATLDQAEQDLGLSVAVSLARVNLAAQHESDEAKSYLRQIEQAAANFSADDRFRVLTRVIEVLRQIRAAESARGLINRLAAAFPQRLEPQAMRVRSAIDVRDTEAWRVGLQAVRTVEGQDGPVGNYLEALGLMELESQTDAASTRLDSAKRLLSRASVVRPDWKLLHRARGNLAHRMGDREAAFAHFHDALEDGDESREVVEYVVRHLSLQRRFDEADRILQRVAARRPEVLSGELARIAWQVAWEQRQFDDWVRVTEEIAEQSGSFRDRILLSQFRFARGRRGDEVEQPLREAVKMAPEAPQPRLALVSYLVRVDQREDARKAIDALQDELPETMSPLVTAQCHEIMGETEQATAAYLKALELQPDDFSRLITVADFFIRQQNADLANKYLAAILDPESTAPRVALAWARRRQSLMIGTRGGYRDTARALELLRQNFAGSGQPEVADLLAQAQLLARRNNRRDRTRALRILEQVAERQALGPADQFTLAVLYDATDNWAASRGALLTLLTEDRSRVNPAHVAFYISASIRRKEPREAALWMDRLEQIQPDTFRTTVLRSRCLAALGSGDGAVEHLQAFLASRPGEEQTGLLPRAATLCEQLGEPEAAEAFHRQFAALDKTPRAQLLLARFLSGHGQLSEAMELWDSVGRTPASRDLLAAAGVSLVSRNDVSSAHLDRVDRWFDKVTKEGQSSAAIVLALGDLRMLQRRFDEAARLYRMVLRQAPDNLIALNNLAWLLAYRGSDLPEALQRVDAAIELVGPTAELLDTRAMVHLAAGRHSAALADLADVVPDLPSGAGYYHLALVHRQRNDRKAATAAWQAANDSGLRLSSLHPLEQIRYANCRKWIEAE